MTLSQPFRWLSLSFPTWTLRWLGHVISKALPILTPSTQGPKRLLPLLKKHILSWLKHQERFPFLGYEHISPETVTLTQWGGQQDGQVSRVEN